MRNIAKWRVEGLATLDFAFADPLGSCRNVIRRDVTSRMQKAAEKSLRGFYFRVNTVELATALS
ncbi:hypothetical protein MFFC18_11150 [Mariniblastus fucicola]|uniref:Uncharacterized protein n=1 Tax=Mariniblastus fucicola TaxID=980251 RepID=A0A5B9P8Q6_9BACT|nr:hypothetical protein MFFC18_11150 [Mariniblastus fucicola]